MQIWKIQIMWNSEIIMIRNNYEKLYLKICYTYIFIYMYVPQIIVEKSLSPLNHLQFCNSWFVAQWDPDGACFARNNYADPIYAIYLTLAINTTSYQFINFRGRLPLLRLRIRLAKWTESSTMKNSSCTLLVVDRKLMSLSLDKA